MPKPRMSRQNLMPKLAKHVLEHGLAGLSLRPLAKAAGTSDRMLLYHFRSKDRLEAELLETLATVFADSLDTAFPQGRCGSRRECFERVLAVTAEPEFAPFFRLWWDIVAGCSRGNAGYLASAGKIIDRLLQWVEDHLPEGDPDPVAGAKIVLTMIEGSQMFDAIGRGRIGRDAAAALE